MTTDFIALQENMSVAKAMRYIQKKGTKERVSYPYVVDRNGTLVGIVPFDKLVFSSRDVGVRTIMEGEVFSVTAETDQEEVGKLVRRYDLYAVPVVDSDSRLVGVVTVDDAILIPTQGAYTWSLRQHFIEPVPRAVLLGQDGAAVHPEKSIGLPDYRVDSSRNRP